MAAILNIRRLILLVLTCVFMMPSAARADMVDYPVIKLQSLDKITARTMTFEARVGSTVKFGPLYIKIRSCRKAPPIETPESAAFLQIWEVTPKDESKWVFSGWMFASSPALSPMDHPIYDVWVLDCLEQKTGTAEGGEEPDAAKTQPDSEPDGEAAPDDKSADADADADADAADDAASQDDAARGE